MRDALIELNIATRPDHVFEAFLESLLPDTREILQLVIHGETIQSIAKSKDIAAYRARKVVETALEQLQICTLEQLQLRYLNLELNA
jgi:radical SAM superfamily enzyme